MSKFTIKQNSRTLVRGYFANTISKINELIIEVNETRYLTYSKGAVKSRLQSIKNLLSTELDEMAKDVSEHT